MGGLLSRTGNRLRRFSGPICAAAIALGFAAATASAGGHTTVSRVLVTGGETVSNGTATSSAEVWDSTTGTFTLTGPMAQERKFHTASVLATGPNAGQVLVAGGYDSGNNTLATAELYSSTTSFFSGPIAMTASRAYHTATVLNDGRVLITGGKSGTPLNEVVLDTAEIYDPATASFKAVTCPVGSSTSTDCMTSPRTGHTATLLGNGQVLIAGGATTINGAVTNSAELFDPTLNAFTSVASAMSDSRELDAAVLLNNGTVLIAGGIDNFAAVTVSADLFDPATSTFSAVQSSLFTGRFGLTATILNNGKALIAGGGPTEADLYTQRTGLFTAARGTMNDSRSFGTATKLNDGTVLFAGGGNSSAEIANLRASNFVATGSMSVPREGHTATLLP